VRRRDNKNAAPRPTGGPVVTAVAKLDDVARRFGAVCGVVDVTLEIPNTVVGLLGPNGAGKSTLLNLLTGRLLPSSGTVRVFGLDPARKPEVFRRTGYCSETDALFEDMTPREMLGTLARLHGFRGPERARRVDRAIERLDLGAAATRKCAALSKGTRQRARIAAAVLHEPEFLVLDEPMTGLDPTARRNVLDLIETWASAGRAVLFSSHILREVEAAARHVVVVHRGMTLAEGTVAHLHDCLSHGAFVMEFEAKRPRELAAAFLGRPFVTGVSLVSPTRLRVEATSSAELTEAAAKVVVDAGMADEIEEIVAPDENLETLFRRLVKS
jgi:ABC-2 type transport system ATP-binding protein